MTRRKRFLIVGGLLVGVGLAIYAWVWSHRDVSFILPTGPFARHFEQGMYPNHAKDIEEWFAGVLPHGTSKEAAKRILAASFSVDLTSGRWTVVHRSSLFMAGGCSTRVILRFDKDGGFEEVHVDQQWAYL
jgi:hypothetical protein